MVIPLTRDPMHVGTFLKEYKKSPTADKYGRTSDWTKFKWPKFDPAL